MPSTILTKVPKGRSLTYQQFITKETDLEKVIQTTFFLVLCRKGHNLELYPIT